MDTMLSPLIGSRFKGGSPNEIVTLTELGDCQGSNLRNKHLHDPLCLFLYQG